MMRRRSPVSSPNDTTKSSPGTSSSPLISKREPTGSSSTTNKTKTTNTLSSWLVLLPLATTGLIFSSFLLLEVSYHHFVIPLIKSYERIPLQKDYNFHETFRNEFTYYDRHCSKDDLTTSNSTDLIITEDMTGEEAAQVMARHGAVAVPGMLQKDTAANLHAYLANKHAEPLHYNEVFWQEMHRLSLALGTKDHPSVAAALQDVGTNDVVKRTLEGILGPNPALVEISTLTARSGCEHQGIHTDSDWFGSSLLYGRSFLHSYSMFIALQDTTQALGATTVCPGSHMCANEDLEEVCMENGAFSVSTNGKTGPEEGMLGAGDGFLFNQNIWHRGPANTMNKDRIMFILTFASSKREQVHDFRRQGLGTYYYMRWNMWGHTFNDLKHATTRMVQPWGGMRALGLLPSSGGVPWIHQFAQQISNGDDFYNDYELGNMRHQLLSDKPSFLFSTEQQWKPFITGTFRLWSVFSGIIYAVSCLGSVVLFPKSKKQIVQLHAGGLLVFAVVYGYMRQTDLGRSVTSGHIFHRPITPYHPDLITPGNRLTSFPERNDVLFGTRMDSDFLASFRHFMDYHPGNQDFLENVRRAAESEATDTDAAASIVHSMLQESEMGMARRFLLQNHTNGAWEVLSMVEATEWTRRKVLTQRHAETHNTARVLEHQLTIHRFGRHRDTPGAKQAAKETEASLEKTLRCRDGKSCVDWANAEKEEIISREPHIHSIPEIGDKIWAWDDREGGWMEAILTGISQGETYEFELFSDAVMERPIQYVRPYYRVTSGDRVMVDYEGDGREFFHGKIEYVYPDGHCLVLFDDGEVSHFVPRAWIFLLPETNGEGEGGDYDDAGDASATE